MVAVAAAAVKPEAAAAAAVVAVHCKSSFTVAEILVLRDRADYCLYD